jgi:hypothetical protein
LSDVYVALLGVEFTIAVFLAGGVAAVAQVVATQVSQSATALFWRSRLLWAGILLLVGSTIWSLAAAALLADGSIGPTSVAAGAQAAIATGLLAGLSVLLLGRALTTAVRLLDPLEAVRRLLAVTEGDDWARFVVGTRAMAELTDYDRAAAAQGLGLDPMTTMLGERLPELAVADRPAAESEETPADVAGADSDIAVREFLSRLSERHRVRGREVAALQRHVRDGRLADPLGPAFEVVGRSLAQHPDRQFKELLGRVVDRGLAMRESATCVGLDPAEVRSLLLHSLFDDHIGPLVRAGLDVGRLSHAASVSRVISARERSGRSVDVSKAAFAVSHRLARSLVEARAPGPLCSVIEDMATVAIVVGAMPGDLAALAFHEVCRGLGELGQRIPRVFNPPGEPELTIGPHATELAGSVPLDALLLGTWQIKEALFEKPGKGPSPSIWVATVEVTAREIARYSTFVLKTNRLEESLFDAVDQVADLGIVGARVGDEKWTMFAGNALMALAREADAPFWSEYPTFVAIRLAEIAVWAFDRDISVRGLRSTPFGKKLAMEIAASLPGAVGYVVDGVRSGRFDEASDDANDKLLAALGMPS